MADEAENDAPEWSPPKHDAETGVALYRDLPLNHRLRAEALADAGETEDLDGLITPELISDASNRLAADRAAEEKAHPPISASMRVAELERIAAREEVDLSTATNNDERVSLIQAKRDGINPASAGSTEG